MLLLLCNNIVDVLGIVGRSDNNKRANQKKRMTMAIAPDDRLFVFKIKSQTFYQKPLKSINSVDLWVIKLLYMWPL